MKKQDYRRLAICLLACACAFHADLTAQKRPLEVTAMASWGFQGSVSTYEGKFDLQNAWSYGGTIDVPVQDDVSFELMYNYSKVKTTIERPPTYLADDLWDMTISYYHGGVMYNRPLQKNLTGFTTMTLGATYFSPQDAGYDGETFFSLALGMGAKLYMSDRIGLRLQGRFLLPILWASGGLWCGGGGCSAGVSGGSSIPAFELGGGIILRL